MKASELRIGNYHYYTCEDSLDERKKWNEVCQIDSQDLVWLESNPDDEDFKSIPLTAELLFKLGNVKQTKDIDVLEVFERFGFTWKDGWYVFTKSGDYLTKIEFVHEYQNFIFSLTETELTLKEKNE